MVRGHCGGGSGGGGAGGAGGVLVLAGAGGVVAPLVQGVVEGAVEAAGVEGGVAGEKSDAVVRKAIAGFGVHVVQPKTPKDDIPSVRNMEATFQRMIFNSTRVV